MASPQEIILALTVTVLQIALPVLVVVTAGYVYELRQTTRDVEARLDRIEERLDAAEGSEQ